MIKALFLDRDGIINHEPPPQDYVKKWEEFEFIPGIEEVISKANKRGYKVIVITNQRGIARKLMTEADLKKIHQLMLKELAEKGAKIDAIYYCPHNYDECSCRKPAPGMFLQAIKDHQIEARRSIMVGNSTTDAQAAAKAGLGIILTVNLKSREDLKTSWFDFLKKIKKAIEINA